MITTKCDAKEIYFETLSGDLTWGIIAIFYRESILFVNEWMKMWFW